jgi:hypothetical protein
VPTQIPLADITAFPKLARAYYTFFEILFRNHIHIVLQLDTPVFTQVSSLLSTLFFTCCYNGSLCDGDLRIHSREGSECNHACAPHAPSTVLLQRRMDIG